jgi:hypothetical protein
LRSGRGISFPAAIKLASIALADVRRDRAGNVVETRNILREHIRHRHRTRRRQTNYEFPKPRDGWLGSKGEPGEAIVRRLKRLWASVLKARAAGDREPAIWIDQVAGAWLAIFAANVREADSRHALHSAPLDQAARQKLDRAQTDRERAMAELITLGWPSELTQNMSRVLPPDFFPVNCPNLSPAI